MVMLCLLCREIPCYVRSIGGFLLLGQRQLSGDTGTLPLDDNVT